MYGNINNAAFNINCSILNIPIFRLLEAMKSCLEIIKAFAFLFSDVVYHINEWL